MIQAAVQIQTMPDRKKTYTFKLGHEAKEGHVKYANAEKFKEELEARSNLLNDYTVQLRLPFVNVVGFYSLNFKKYSLLDIPHLS